MNLGYSGPEKDFCETSAISESESAVDILPHSYVCKQPDHRHGRYEFDLGGGVVCGDIEDMAVVMIENETTRDSFRGGKDR